MVVCSESTFEIKNYNRLNYLSETRFTQELVSVITSESAREYGIKKERAKSKFRELITKEARFVSMYLIREKTNLTLKDIGKNFEDRHHSTVLHAIKTTKDLLLNDRIFRNRFNRIKRNVEERILRLEMINTE